MTRIGRPGPNGPGRDFTISTVGSWSCQAQKTETAAAPAVNSTRIHDGSFQTCIDQPVAGVAETSLAEAFL